MDLTYEIRFGFFDEIYEEQSRDVEAALELCLELLVYIHNLTISANLNDRTAEI